MAKEFLVAGGINLDIKGFPESALARGDSVPGQISLSPGGVAANIAFDLAALGAKNELLGVIGQDSFGDHLLHRIQAAGIKSDRILRSSSHRTGTYLEILDRGEAVCAVSDMEICRQLQASACTTWPEAVDHADMLIIDSNLPTAILDLLTHRALSRRIPIAADPVSASKAEILRPLLDRIEWIFPNEIEWEVLNSRSPGVPDSLGCCITRGEKGVQLLLPGRREAAQTIAVSPESQADAAGAGDAFAAGFCFALSRGKSPFASVEVGCRCAAAVLRTKRSSLTQGDIS